MTSGSGGRGNRVLAGRYRLDEVIGRGGMSTVYRGTDLALDRVVAVKVALDPLAEENPVYVARFKREARAAAAVTHPGIVTVYDAGADGPTRFIVMEYVAGRSLAQIMGEHDPARPLDPARAARIATGVADALSAAHAAGIVHRDIKPGNVMVTDDGSVKVLDFGIARTDDASTLTRTALVLGTAPYMSPEQALGQPADPRSDVYSLGCVLYEMLTGQPPFMAEVAAGVMHQHVRVAPKPAVALNPKVPQALNALVLRMLAKSPDDRPQTVHEVRDRLTEAAGESRDEAPGGDPIPGDPSRNEAPPPAGDPIPVDPVPGDPRRNEAAPSAGDPTPGDESRNEARPSAGDPTPRDPIAGDPSRTAAKTVPRTHGAAGQEREAGARPTGPTQGLTGRTQEPTAPTRVAERPSRPPGRSGPRGHHARRRAMWGAAVVLAALIVGAAVALAVTSGSGTSSNTTPPARATSTPHTSPPVSSTARTTTPTTTSTSTPTSTPTTTSTPSSTTTPGSTTPPGQGGAPPGQAKKQSGG